MDVGGLIAGVTLDVAATSKRQALSRVADTAARATGLPLKRLTDGLLEREALGSTGLGGGVAVPHARIEGLQQVVIVFVKLETPLAFQAVDDQPVDLLFGLFAPAGDGPLALRALAAVSRAIRKPAFREQLRQARSPDAVRALFLPQSSAEAA